jgi:Flp pilus assembly protein TadG
MRSRHLFLQNDTSRAGALTVEMAFALPILLLIVFSAVDFARLNMLRNSAENAAYEAARRAIVPGATATQASDAAKKVLKAVGASNCTVTITPATLTEDTTQVTVKVEIPLKNNAWLASAAKTTKVLTKSCTMTREKIKNL